MIDVNDLTVQKILHSKAFAHLATLGANGEPQSSPMWFLWDGESIKFTHTTTRKKYQNIKHDPRVSISITDVDEPYTYAEFRGAVERIEDDPEGAFFNTLAERYEFPIRYQGEPRVILVVKIQHIVGQNLGSRYTQVLVAQPDIDLYAAVSGVRGLQEQGMTIVQEVRTGEALTIVFKSVAALSAETVEDIRRVPGVWSLSANLDGRQREAHEPL